MGRVSICKPWQLSWAKGIPSYLSSFLCDPPRARPFYPKPQSYVGLRPGVG